MAAGYLLLELFRQSITLWLQFLMIRGCLNVYFVSYLAPFRWPNIQNDLALAKKVAARKPQTHQDWDEIATVLSGVLGSESNRVDLKGRGCRERLARLIEKDEQDVNKVRVSKCILVSSTVRAIGNLQKYYSLLF